MSLGPACLHSRPSSLRHLTFPLKVSSSLLEARRVGRGGGGQEERVWPPTPQHSIVLPGFLSFSDTTSHRKVGHARCAVSLTPCSLSSHRRGVFAQYQGRPRIPESQIALFSVMCPRPQWTPGSHGFKGQEGRGRQARTVGLIQRARRRDLRIGGCRGFNLIARRLSHCRPSWERSELWVQLQCRALPIRCRAHSSRRSLAVGEARRRIF